MGEKEGSNEGSSVLMSDGWVLVDAVATARFIHDGEQLYPGAAFRCTESELDDLRVLGFAQRAPRVPVAETPIFETPVAYATTVLVPEPSPQDPVPRTKRPYRRRDMSIK